MLARECLERSFDHHWLSAEWIHIRKPDRTQRKLALHLARFAIEQVADHRMRTRCKVNANLMRAPRDRFGKEQRFAAVRRDPLEMRNRRLVLLRVDSHQPGAPGIPTD